MLILNRRTILAALATALLAHQPDQAKAITEQIAKAFPAHLPPLLTVGFSRALQS